MSKVISAGILLEHNGLFLLGHPTELTGTTHGWGILKGKVDEGEEMFQAAMREFEEESGVGIKEGIYSAAIDVTPRPFFKYSIKNKKTVYVYWAVDYDGYVFSQKLHCPSLVPNTDKPEIDAYTWVELDKAIQLVTESQKDLFRQVKTLTDRK